MAGQGATGTVENARRVAVGIKCPIKLDNQKGKPNARPLKEQRLKSM